MADQEPRSPGAADPATDDDFWSEGDDADRGTSGLSPWVLGAGALIVVVIIALLLTRGSDDEDEPSASGPTTSVAQSGGDGSPGSQETSTPGVCLNWPKAVSNFAEPDIASEPGLHLWIDVSGWHVRRVPGEGVPAGTVEFTTMNADHPLLVGDASGGATSVAEEGGRVVLTFPASDQVADAAFKVPFYANGVVVEATAEGGAPLAPEQLTLGFNTEPIDAFPFPIERQKVPC